MGPSERREKAIQEARRRWDGAPVTFKAMAAAYVGPLLEALEAIGGELDAAAPPKCCNHDCNQGRDCPQRKGAGHA